MIMKLNSMQNFHLKNHFLKMKFLIFVILGRKAVLGRGRECIQLCHRKKK